MATKNPAVLRAIAELMEISNRIGKALEDETDLRLVDADDYITKAVIMLEQYRTA